MNPSQQIKKKFHPNKKKHQNKNTINTSETAPDQTKTNLKNPTPPNREHPAWSIFRYGPRRPHDVDKCPQKGTHPFSTRWPRCLSRHNIYYCSAAPREMRLHLKHPLVRATTLPPFSRSTPFFSSQFSPLVVFDFFLIFRIIFVSNVMKIYFVFCRVNPGQPVIQFLHFEFNVLLFEFKVLLRPSW